jgi:hypothetical protein
MSRYLVLANQTLCGEGLQAAVSRRINSQDCELYFVVPATPRGEQHFPEPLRESRHHSSTAEYAEARRLGSERLDGALGHYLDLGATKVDGEVGDSDPMIAIGDALGRESGFAKVIISTLPHSLSRWLHLDLAHRVHRHYGIPVVQVESRPSPV